MSKAGGTIPVLFNARAGGTADATRRLEAALARHGVRGAVRAIEPERLTSTLQALRDMEAPLVAVAGGDGTLRAAAEVFAGGDTILAVVPTGTLNHFARRLGVPDLDAAVRALVDQCAIRVPLGVVDERVFLNTATFGQYAEVVQHRERLRKWLGKWPAATIAFARAARRLHPMSLEIDLPGGRIERATPLVWVGLGRSSFPRARRSDAPIDAADLEVVIADVRSGLPAVAFGTRLLVRALRDRPASDDRAVETLHTGHLLLRGPVPVEATLDGEVFRLRPPVSVSFQPRALRVLAPAAVG